MLALKLHSEAAPKGGHVKRAITLSILLLLLGALVAQADVMWQPVAAPVNTFGQNDASDGIENTFNQSGLSTPYVSGVTDRGAYLAGNPQHSLVFTTEWFSQPGVLQGTVVYDLGAVVGVDGVAMWNEDSNGISRFLLSGSADGVTFSPIGAFAPTDNPINADYGADFFGFSLTQVRYLQLEISGAGPEWTSMGEFAASVQPVPEPSSILLLGSGLFGVAGALRRKLTK